MGAMGKTVTISIFYPIPITLSGTNVPIQTIPIYRRTNTFLICNRKVDTRSLSRILLYARLVTNIDTLEIQKHI